MPSHPAASQDFVAQEHWPDVSKMLDGFGAPDLPASPDLAGRTLQIDYDDGSSALLSFSSASEFTVTVDAEEPTASHGYRSVEVRPGIHLLDFVTGEGVGTHDVTMVVDLADGRVTTADSRIVDGADIRTATTFLTGRLSGTGPIEPRQRTDALVGKRIYYRYSPTERYEHIYLNSGTFVWHCIDGGERGLADVDETRTFELADDIHIFYWKESVMPVESFLVIDLAAQRSIGRMFCWEASTSEPVHLPFDSRFTVLNETTYPND